MKQIHIYTDGACSGNPGPGGAGYIICEISKGEILPFLNGSDPYRHTTNNRMEIMAVINALIKFHEFIEKFHEFIENGGDQATVYTDSQLVYGTMMLGWKRKTNQDLWERLDQTIGRLRSKDCSVTFVKTKGHADDEWNNIADELAVKASHADPATAKKDEGYETESIQTNLFPKPTDQPAPSRESRYVVVQWPDIQFLMDKPGFREHAYLVNDDRGMADFGSSAYFVEEAWLNENA